MNRELSNWAKGLVGEGKRFRSARAWSLQADLNENAALKVMDRGTADAMTLAKLARTAGENPLRVLQLAGLITEDELPKADGSLPSDEISLLSSYRTAKDRRLQPALGAFRVAVDTVEWLDREESSRVESAEEAADRRVRRAVG